MFIRRQHASFKGILQSLRGAVPMIRVFSTVVRSCMLAKGRCSSKGAGQCAWAGATWHLLGRSDASPNPCAGLRFWCRGDAW